METNGYIPLEEAKASIIAALNQFHRELGARAAQILHDDRRMNIVENPDNKTQMMMCRPAGLTLEQLKKNDMYLEDFEERFAPHFKRQDNPESYAIIDYEYDGSPESVVYLAHELGHAIADDIQIENGRSYKDFTPAQAEEQAYFIQNIYARYTGLPSAETSYQDDLEKGILKISWERACQYKNAWTEFEQALAMDPEGRKNRMIHVLEGPEESTGSIPAPKIKTNAFTNPAI